jgi:hypothetical protein
VTGDWDNSFLILAVPSGQVKAKAYLLFDIGAEYAECRFICPSFGFDQVAEEGMIRRYVPKLARAKDPFAILATSDGTYIQTYCEKGKFDVEYQLVSLASHYCLEKSVDARTAVSIFLSYAFGKKEWAREYKWKRMEL